MLCYCQIADSDSRRRASERTQECVWVSQPSAAMEATGDRDHPKMLTGTSAMTSLMPLIGTTGIGSGVDSRIGLPVRGGVVSSALLNAMGIPAVASLVVATTPRKTRAHAELALATQST